MSRLQPFLVALRRQQCLRVILEIQQPVGWLRIFLRRLLAQCYFRLRLVVSIMRYLGSNSQGWRKKYHILQGLQRGHAGYGILASY